MGGNAASVPKREPSFRETWSATIAKAKSSVSFGWTGFSGNAVSCAQQHLTLGVVGELPESHGGFGAVLWQHDDSFTGTDSSR
jgi:hypothetical protein